MAVDHESRIPLAPHDIPLGGPQQFAWAMDPVNAVVRNGSALVKLKSNFGGSATVRLTLVGDGLRWKLVKSRGENFYPRDVTLRRLGPEEKPPYVADEEDEQ